MALISPDFTFTHQRLHTLDLNAFSPFFGNLVEDRYVSGHYRSRRYSQFTGQADCLERLPHDNFTQSSSVNYLSGDIRRDFAEITPPLADLPEFKQLLKSVTEFFGINPEQAIFGVHQIRVTCSGTEGGLPVPEGIHQDGFELVAVFCVARSNIEGAETCIFNHPEQKPVYHSTLLPGDIVYCNDRRVYHYTSPLHAISEQFNGYRDVFVITVNLKDEQWKSCAMQKPSTASASSFQRLDA